MSASAVKSSMPGVGTSPTSASHSMLPMNAMAQKVVPGTESGSIKPMSGTGLSYVTLQPASQPLSLVQDHRPPVYQGAPYISNSAEKESEPDKVVPNGVEIAKLESDEDIANSVKQNECNRNNNLSPSNSTQNQQQETQDEQELTPLTLDTPALCSQAPSKGEEKKSSVNNGSKESEGIPVNASSQTKLPLHKPEESQAKTDVQKSKPVNQNLKPISENSSPPTSTAPTKVDIKVSGSPKTNKRKSRELKDLKGGTAVTDGASKPKRNRIQTQPYQSPLPEIALLVKTLNKTPTTKAPDDKLIVFYKNEFLAVRNAEGSFYVCQAMQNIYKSSRRIRIRWLSQDKNNGEIYSPDFYDIIDFDCILTNLNLNKIDKNKFQLTKIELLRTENILKRAIDVEAGVSEKPRVTEEHPDGLDLSLYKDESQLKRRRGHGLHKQKQSQRKKFKQAASTSEEETVDENAEKKTSKASRSKKQSVNKALAIAKSVAKGTSRAERALNRSTKSNNSPATDAVTTTSPLNATSTTDSPKTNTDTKKNENKKNIKQQSNNATGVQRTKFRGTTQNVQQGSSVAARPKRVSANVSTTAASTGAGTGTGTATATAMATGTGTGTGTAILSQASEEASPRKKPRSRA